MDLVFKSAWTADFSQYTLYRVDSRISKIQWITDYSVAENFGRDSRIFTSESSDFGSKRSLDQHSLACWRNYGKNKN